MTPSRLTVNDLRSPVVGSISFALATGECMALMGASGSGKSTLLRLLADLDPSEGQVALNGQARDRMNPCEWRRRVMLVPAHAGWWSEEVAEHFSPERRPRLAELAASLRLPDDILDRTVATLSTGERQRLGLIRGLVETPDVLLLDEPTSGLDADTTLQVERCLDDARARGVAIVLVTHDIAQARRMGSRTCRLHAGALEWAP